MISFILNLCVFFFWKFYGILRFFDINVFTSLFLDGFIIMLIFHDLYLPHQHLLSVLPSLHPNFYFVEQSIVLQRYYTSCLCVLAHFFVLLILPPLPSLLSIFSMSFWSLRLSPTYLRSHSSGLGTLSVPLALLANYCHLLITV